MQCFIKPAVKVMFIWRQACLNRSVGLFLALLMVIWYLIFIILAKPLAQKNVCAEEQIAGQYEAKAFKNSLKYMNEYSQKVKYSQKWLFFFSRPANCHLGRIILTFKSNYWRRFIKCTYCLFLTNFDFHFQLSEEYISCFEVRRVYELHILIHKHGDQQHLITIWWMILLYMRK